jgi:hypothetical protein
MKTTADPNMTRNPRLLIATGEGCGRLMLQENMKISLDIEEQGT